MMDERDLIRHLENGGPELWEPSPPPPLDVAAITGERHDPAPAAPARVTSTARAQRRQSWFPRPLTGLLAGGLACMAIGVGLGAALFGGEPSPTPVASSPAPSRQVSLKRLGDAPPSATALAKLFASAIGDKLEVRVSGMPALQPGAYYELWALGTEGRMVSLGNLPIDATGNGEGTFELPVRLSQFPILDISLELADGNPAHSGRSLLRSTA